MQKFHGALYKILFAMSYVEAKNIYDNSHKPQGGYKRNELAPYNNHGIIVHKLSTDI